MAARVVSRLALLGAALVLATMLLVGAMAALASSVSADPVMHRDHVAAVERGIRAPADGESAPDASPTPAVVLVFAGIVVLATLPPVQRVHVYHRSYQRSDWI